MEKGHKKFIIIGGIILVFIITLIISQSYIKNIKLNNEIENIIEEKNYEVKKSWQKRLNLQKMHVQQCYAE